MDKQTIDSLKKALAATPDNSALFFLILKGYLDLGEESEAYSFLQENGTKLEPERPEDHYLLGQVCLAAGDLEAALKRCQADSPECHLLRARAYLESDQTEAARVAYERAVAGNATCQDKDLEARLKARVPKRTITREGKVTPLKVIANDDTDREETVRILMPEQEKVTFAEVGGLDGIKNQITKKIILPFQKPSLFQRFKKRVGGGILLYGPPGCGKTLLARATAGECQARFFNVAISDILDMYIGESERKLHAIFENARRAAPAVLFFDEIEAIGGKRQYSREGTSSKMVSQFLSEMDGFSNNNSGVLILGATNVPWAVDAAFRRPGRFDRVLFVPPPDRTARERIFAIHLEDRPVSGDLSVPQLAAGSSGFSGADILNVVETATDLAIEASLERGEEVPIDGNLLRAAFEEVVPTTLEWLTTARNYARYANESGQYNEVLDFLKKHGKN